MYNDNQFPKDILHWTVDEWTGNLLSRLSLLDAEILLKFVPNITVTADAPVRTISYMKLDEIDLDLNFERLLKGKILNPRKPERQKEDRYLVTVPVPKITSNIIIDVETRDRRLLVPGASVSISDAGDVIWIAEVEMPKLLERPSRKLSHFKEEATGNIQNVETPIKMEKRMSQAKKMKRMKKMKKYRFVHTLPSEVLKESNVKDIYEGIEFLIKTITPPINPMTNGDTPVWSWGLLVVNDTSIPAPYKDHGYTSDGMRIELTEEMSGITNTFVWLDLLLSLKRLSTEQLMAIDGMFLYSSLDWIDTIGFNKVSEIVSILRSIVREDPSGYQIID